MAQYVLSQLNAAYYFSKHFCWQLLTSGNRNTHLQRSKEQLGNLFIHSHKSFYELIHRVIISELIIKQVHCKCHLCWLILIFIFENHINSIQLLLDL